MATRFRMGSAPTRMRKRGRVLLGIEKESSFREAQQKLLAFGSRKELGTIPASTQDSRAHLPA